MDTENYAVIDFSVSKALSRNFFGGLAGYFSRLSTNLGWLAAG